MPGTSGIMLCGSSTSWNSNFLAELIGLSGVGGSRASVDVSTNADSGGWGRRIVSCIRRGKPFRATIAFSPRSNWVTAMELAPASAFTTWTITWPNEVGYSNAGSLAWSVALTDFTLGGMLEDRMLAEVELTPTGAPTVNLGT